MRKAFKICGFFVLAAVSFSFVGCSSALWGGTYGNRPRNAAGEEIAKITISFDAGSPAASGKMDAVTGPFDEAFSLPACAFSLEKHSFAGWATEKGGEKVFDDAAHVMFGMDSGAFVTLYALWAEVCETKSIDDTSVKTDEGALAGLF